MLFKKLPTCQTASYVKYKAFISFIPTNETLVLISFIYALLVAAQITQFLPQMLISWNKLNSAEIHKQVH